MPRALLYHLLETWATDPHHRPRPLAQARKKGTPAMSDRLAAHLPPAIRNLPARTRRLTIGAAAAITIGAAVAIPALLAGAARPGNAVFTGHTGTVYSVAFSPDGKTLASASRDRTVRLWNVATHRQIGNPLTGHAGGVTSVAFSPDGKTLATGSGDRTVRLWDVATHRQIGNPIAGHTGTVFSVAFSPDGKTVASGSFHDTAQLWDVATHRRIGKPFTGGIGAVLSVAFSPDGKTLAAGTGYDTVRLWNMATHRQVGNLTGHPGPVTSAAFSPDGKTVASGAYDTTVRLWDVATHRQIGKPLTGHTREVWSVAFSPDGKTLATGSEDGTVRLWDMATHRQIGGAIAGHAGGVWSVAFSPDGKTLATGSEDHTVRLWDVATHRQISGATTATGPPTNGLEKKSPADVLQAAAAALRAAKSVHVAGSDPPGHFDYRIQGSSTIGTITLPRGQTRFRVIGRYGYVKTDFGYDAGRWLKYPSQAFEEFTIAQWASFSGNGPLEPKVQQATVNGRKVVVVNWRNGSKLYVANTGPAYPLREEFNGNYPVQMVFSEYNVPLDIAAPSNAIDASTAG